MRRRKVPMFYRIAPPRSKDGAKAAEDATLPTSSIERCDREAPSNNQRSHG